MCSLCESKVDIINKEIPVFLSEEQGPRSTSTGLMSQLFEQPLVYNFLVHLKYLIASDKHIGVREMVDRQSLLNIGCGSNTEAPYLEYDIHALTKFAATDISKPFVIAAQENCSRKDANFCVASIQNLPYPDSSFDVVIMPFVLHHLPFPLTLGLREGLRVARKYVVIYDHIKSNEPWMRMIQESYWRLFDGGAQYLDENAWKEALQGFRIVRMLRTGAIGRHVVKFILEK